MNSPWEERTSEQRSIDSIYNFIIFCEDEVSEPLYFKRLQKDNVKITTFPGKKDKHQQVDDATDYCRANSLLEKVKGKEQLAVNEGTEVWCVFDRDKEENDGKDSSFNNSINNSIGIQVAWSNDAFELWLLLHFEDIAPDDYGFAHRDKYYERLTEILRQQIEHVQEDFRNVISNKAFNYKNAMKKQRNYTPIMSPLLKDNIEIAIKRASLLEEFHFSQNTAYHEKTPCTMVHKLVKRIIEKSKE